MAEPAAAAENSGVVARSKKRRVGESSSSSSDTSTSSASNNNTDALLRSAKAFILSTFQESSSTIQGGNKERWERLDLDWKCEWDVALAAIDSGIVDNLQSLPERLRDDRGFLMAAVRQEPQTWLTLPAAFADDTEFLDMIAEFDYTLTRAIFERIPSLRSNRDFWTKLISNHHLMEAGILVELFEPVCLFEEFAPTSIRADLEIMQMACRKDSKYFAFVDPSLFRTRESVEQLAATAECMSLVDFVKFMPHDVQLQWPDIVIKSVRNLNRSYLLQPDWIAPALWKNNRELVKTWFQTGGRYVETLFPPEWKADKEIFLLIAENCPSHWCLDSFRQASEALRNDKDFMLQVIETKAELFQAASLTLRRDFDVVIRMLAVTVLPPVLLLYEQAPREFRSFLTDNGVESVERIRSKGMDKLNAHANFTSLVLPAMKFSGSLTGLSLLNQGTETARGFKGRIADFLGVPIGKDLRILRHAMGNLPDKSTIGVLVHWWSVDAVPGSING